MLSMRTGLVEINRTLERIDELEPGVDVVTRHWDTDSGFNGSILDKEFVLPDLSGLLQAPPRAMPTYEGGLLMGIGMLFEGREKWGVTPELPWSKRIMTDPERIEEFYSKAAGSEEAKYQLHQGRECRMGRGLYQLIETMTHLSFDIKFDDPQITSLHKAARNKLNEYIVPSHGMKVLEDLPLLHTLDRDLGEDRVGQYATLDISEGSNDTLDYSMFKKQLIGVLARIRSQDDCWRFDDMTRPRQEVYEARAALELAEIRLDASE